MSQTRQERIDTLKDKISRLSDENLLRLWCAVKAHENGDTGAIRRLVEQVERERVEVKA